MAGKAARMRITRGLRFRLTASYGLFLAILLIGVTGLFRERLEFSLDSQAHEVLEQEWAALKGYLKIERGQPHWFYDRNDPDETFIVERLRRVYLLADAKGRPIQYSDIYRSIGFDSPEEIRAVVGGLRPAWKTRRDAQGTPYLVRAGVVYDEQRRREPYFVAIGRTIADQSEILSDYTLRYMALIPVAILIAGLLGWFLAGRALTPVTAVAETAQRISGSNLSLRIPARGAGDELDFLIETFNQMIERLEASFQQIRQFSTDVSHELRTPITVIRGQLEVALFTARSQEQYREAILNSLQDIERLSQIVRALLLLSQAESGQLALQKSHLDLAAVVRDVVEQFQIPAEGARVQLETDLPPECPAEVDRVQIERMISNLLSNALKFTPEGGRVTVRLRRLGYLLELAVEDTGCGIAAEHLPHIFDRFYRAPPLQTASGTEPGLGLGLSFVAWIAKAHGGAVRVRSKPGEGSRFTVALPAGAGPPAALESPDRALASG